VKRTLPKTVESDVVEIRKAIAARELIVFETTGVTHRPAMTFEQAKKVGETKLRRRSGGKSRAASHIRYDADRQPVRQSPTSPAAKSDDKHWRSVLVNDQVRSCSVWLIGYRG
jgi:hypothetical protein